MPDCTFRYSPSVELLQTRNLRNWSSAVVQYQHRQRSMGLGLRLLTSLVLPAARHVVGVAPCPLGPFVFIFPNLDNAVR